MSDPEPTEVTLVLDEGEITSIASELARTYAAMVRYFRKEHDLTPEQADQKMRELMKGGGDDDRALTAHPEEVDWWQIMKLTEREPEKAIAVWERLKYLAREELASGHRAASAAHGALGQPWDRARLLAIREAFRKEWPLSNGIEAALIDMLAQAHYAYLFWLERLMSRAMFDARYEDGDLRMKGKWRLPRITAVDAQDQAAAMVDRFNRLFMRTLRGLRDLRRYGGKVTIERAGQVNIGEQQVNVAGQRVEEDASPAEATGEGPQAGALAQRGE